VPNLGVNKEARKNPRAPVTPDVLGIPHQNPDTSSIPALVPDFGYLLFVRKCYAAPKDPGIKWIHKRLMVSNLMDISCAALARGTAGLMDLAMPSYKRYGGWSLSRSE
jgi:hypothetical protein